MLNSLELGVTTLDSSSHSVENVCCRVQHQPLVGTNYMAEEGVNERMNEIAGCDLGKPFPHS